MGKDMTVITVMDVIWVMGVMKQWKCVVAIRQV